MLKNSYFPIHSENRMKNEGNIELARQSFFDKRPSNLNFLLSSRYKWMNKFVADKCTVIEIGSGAGFSKEFITNKNLILTDYNSQHDWIDENVDALNMPYKNESIDAIISSHMIHHLATPVKYFEEICRVLKPDGVLLIHDVHTSLLFRILLRLMKHEGYSFTVDVFDKKTIANDPADPWSANCAIPELLFSYPDKFHSVFPELKIIKNELCECLIFPLSGGVIAKTKMVNLPNFILRGVNFIDSILVRISPSVFALGRRVVIQKNSSYVTHNNLSL